MQLIFQDGTEEHGSLIAPTTFDLGDMEGVDGSAGKS